MDLAPLSNTQLSDVQVEELEQRLEMSLLAVPLAYNEDIGACVECNSCEGACNGVQV